MNKVDKDTLIKLLIITVIVLGYLYFFNNDCKELKKEIEEMTVEGNDNIEPDPDADTDAAAAADTDAAAAAAGDNDNGATDNITCGNTDGNNTQFDCSGSDNPLKPDAICTGDPPVCVETTCCVPQSGADAGEQEETTTQGPGRCIPNTLLYSCNKWNDVLDPQIRSCATLTNRESCEYEKVHGPGGDPPDPNADPPYRGFIIPEGAGTNPSICEYSDRCSAEHSEWRNNPERVNPPTNTNNDTQEPSEELLAAREAASAAEEAAFAAVEAANQAEALAQENQGDEAAEAAAEAAEAAAVEAQAEATRLREEEEAMSQNETNVNTNVNGSINALVTQGAGRTLDLDIPTDVINQISGDLGNALSSGDNERSLLAARNLVNNLEYLINAGDDGAEDILARKERIQDLLAQIDTLNNQLQAEGVEFNNINNANQAVIGSVTDNTQQENFANFENAQGDGMITYTNYALLQ